MNIFSGDKKYGIIGTVVFHGIIIAILLLFGFSAPQVEYPEPDGILVDFGDLVIGDNEGGETVSEVVPETTQPVSEEDSYVTQDAVESPVTIKKNKDKVKTPKEPEISPEEQERLRQEAEFKSKMDALAGKIGTGGSNGTGNAGNSSTGASTGNAGSRNGVAGGGKGTTRGNPLGKGDAKDWRTPTGTENCTGKVTLHLQVDRNGKVVKVENPETAISNQVCVTAAINAAKLITFSADANAPETRYATITYDYDNTRK